MLTELDEAQLAELQAAIVSEFETVEQEDPTPQTVDAMTSLADMLDTVRGEVSRREAQVEELVTRAAEAASRVKGATEEVAPEAETETEAPAEEATPEAEEPAAQTEEAPMAEEPEETKEEEVALTPEEIEKKKKQMEEAPMAANAESTLTTEEEPATTLSTEEAAPVAEAPVESAPVEEVVEAAEEAPAVTASADEDTAPVEEAPVEAAAAVEAEVVTEAVAEVTPDAEASIQTQESALVEQKDQEAPVTAAATTEEAFEAPADRRPAAQASTATVAITAGADIPGYTAGSSVSDMKEVAALMSKRLHGLRNVNGGNGEQHIVASVSTTFSDDRTLTADAESNWEKIRAVTSPEAIVASGGHVAPFEVKYDIFGLGTTARPVRDALARFQADRGGIRFVTPPKLSSYANAVGVWTNATDTNPGTDVKASLTVAAAQEQTVATDAVTLQLQFGNLATRAYPELIARHNELGLIQHAREAEQNLLTQIGDASTAVTTTSLIGFGRDFLVQIGRAAAAYRSRHRMEADAPLRAIVPSWVKDAMAADLALSMPGDNTLAAYGEIDGYVAARNVNLSVSLDQDVFGAQSSGALNEFADSFTWYLFAEGSFLFLDRKSDV